MLHATDRAVTVKQAAECHARHKITGCYDDHV